jgi:cytoskeletal protein CcmA (bactofilin family)
MFSKSRKQTTVQLSRLSSLIAEDVVFTGDLSFGSGLRIDGRVIGNVTARSGESDGGALLVLSDKGCVEGSVRCTDALVNGEIRGDLEVENFLELQSSARVSGTIRYRQLKMDVGAVARGQLERFEDSVATDNVVALAADKSTHASRG